MTQVPTVLSIGKGTQDVFLHSDEFDPKTRGKKIFTEIPLGIKMEVDEITFSTGGNATNVAVTFARQGLNSQYMWTLGNDPISGSILEALDKDGVDTRYVVQSDKYAPGFSAILLATNGERTILNNRGKSTGKMGIDLNFEAIEKADWIYPTSLGFGGLELMSKILHAAEKGGTKVMLNPAGPELAEPEKLKSLLDSVDVLITNKEEMQLLVHGETLEELVLHALNLCPVVIVSDGPNGVVASDGKTIVRAGMYEDVPVIDRLGAGDAFASGFLSQWVQGKSLKDSIIFASANSTSVVTKIGAKAGILYKGTRLHDMPIVEKPVV